MVNKIVEPRIEGDQLIIETSNETEVYDSRFLVAAMLVWVAKSDGRISAPETEKMLQLVGERFQLRSAESLEVLTQAITQLAENPDLSSILRGLSSVISADDKEDIAVMMLKVIAADGRQQAAEMDSLREAADILEISPESMHQAFDRYFDDKVD